MSTSEPLLTVFTRLTNLALTLVYLPPSVLNKFNIGLCRSQPTSAGRSANSAPSGGFDCAKTSLLTTRVRFIILAAVSAAATAAPAVAIAVPTPGGTPTVMPNAESGRICPKGVTYRDPEPQD